MTTHACYTLSLVYKGIFAVYCYTTYWTAIFTDHTAPTVLFIYMKPESYKRGQYLQ